MRWRGHGTKGLLAAAAALALSGCELLAPPPPEAAPRPRAPEAPKPAPPSQSQQSRLLAAYYQRVQDDLLALGLLRQGGGGPDTPFSARQLAENFTRIALYDEFTIENGRVSQRETPSRLRRWEQPVRLRLIYSRTMPHARHLKDRAILQAYAARLSRLTDLPVRLVPQGGNFHVLILDEDERRAVGPLVRKLVPGVGNGVLRAITDMPRDTRCLVFAFPEATGSNRYASAIAVIRAEHPDLLRIACIHEEIAQGLGLANDSPHARPSIFNDDEEFGRLTTMDELMLKMLYDKRLRPGMTPEQARPIVERIARELTGGSA